MIYKFKSKATSDLIMLGPHGDRALRLIGREPSPRGILEPVDMPAALHALERAVADSKAVERSQREGADDGGGGGARDPVGLHQRLWPLMQMIERAQAAGEAIVWGV